MTKVKAYNFESRLIALGLDARCATRINAQVNHWIRFHGEEWTVSRLKDLKVGYLHFLANQSHDGTYATDSKGFPRGIFGSFFRFPNRVRKHVALSAFNVYKRLVSKQATKAQLEKFYGSMQRPQPEWVANVVPGLISYFEKGIWRSRVLRAKQAMGGAFLMSLSSGKQLPETERIELDDFVSSPVKRAPGIEPILSFHPMRGEQCRFKPYRATEASMPLVHHAGILLHPDLPKELQPIRKLLSGRIRTKSSHEGPVPKFDELPPVGNINDVPFHAGVVSFIQEPGFKLRAVANPYRVFQWFMGPLGRTLFRFLFTLEEDCTFDQQRGVDFVRSRLQEGEVCCSVDISDATNNMPLSLQVPVLEELVVQLGEPELLPLVRAFSVLSQAPWLCPDGVFRSWTVGQPLGLFPSFPCFALSHNLLLRRLMVARSEGWYRVCGDDVVMSENLYGPYREVLSRMGVPVSEPKTIVSGLIAEFAGKVITPKGVLSPSNHRRITDDSFWDLAAQIGPRVLPLLSSKQRRVVKALSSLPEPWGLGWNPDGLSLIDRLPDQLLELYAKGRLILASKEPRKPVRDVDLFYEVDSSGLSAGCSSAVRAEYNLPGVLSDLRSMSFPVGRNLASIEYEHRGDPGFVFSDVLKCIKREYVLPSDTHTPVVDRLLHFIETYSL